MSTTHPTLDTHAVAGQEGSAPHDGDTLPQLTAATATAEIAYIAREARALRGSDDEQRRARFLARKRALLEFIDQAGPR